MIQEMWELYDVTLQITVSFKFYVMNCVDFVVDFCLHITSHVSQAFASCTHNTSYSLLNIVHINCVCLWFDQPRLKKYLEFYAKLFCQLHTQYKLLFAKLCTHNCVCLWSDQPRLKNTLSFMQNCFVALKMGEIV